MITEALKKWCAENDLTITDKQLAEFETYAKLLVEWNKKMNLTAITEENEIAVKHFIDSMTILKYIEKKSSKIIDIGTGAGFPGIPVKIMRPDIELTLLDSLNKRLVFLEEVCKTLSFNAELIHGRAEEYGQKPEYRECFDHAVSRAVANLPSLCEYCLPYVKTGGSFISMKGPEGNKESDTAQKAIKTLGGVLYKTDTLTLPDESTRTIIIINKQNSTPSKYPRRGVKINKQPIV